MSRNKAPPQCAAPSQVLESPPVCLLGGEAVHNGAAERGLVDDLAASASSPRISALGVRDRLPQEVHGEPDTLLVRHIKAVARPVVGILDLFRPRTARELPKELHLSRSPHAPLELLEVLHCEMGWLEMRERKRCGWGHTIV
jgi:hypothetical protein